MKRLRRISKSEMTGFILLFSLIIAGTLLYAYSDQFFTSKKETASLSPEEIREIENFAQEIKEDSIRQAKKFKKTAYIPKRLTPFEFDPNTADSNTLVRIGLKNWQITNMLKYREKGGRWKNAEDFKRLYGLSDEDFLTLRPYIKIKEKPPVTAPKQTTRDSILKNFPQKYQAGTILQLNEADTTELKKIPGIGSYYASKICRYRERLGGFLNVNQLKEIEGLPQNIEKWFAISSQPMIRKTPINKTDFKGLMRHPYLNYEQVKVIVNYIRKYGKINDLNELSNNEHFKTEDIERLRPYISFE